MVDDWDWRFNSLFFACQCIFYWESNLFFFLFLFLLVLMSIMGRRRTWQLHNLNLQMHVGAFLLGMNLLLRWMSKTLHLPFPFFHYIVILWVGLLHMCFLINYSCQFSSGKVPPELSGIGLLRRGVSPSKFPATILVYSSHSCPNSGPIPTSFCPIFHTSVHMEWKL